MAFKRWFRGSKAPRDESELTVDELIIVERFDEARDRLNERIRFQPQDLHAHLKLAEVYQALGDGESCKQEYLHVATAYAQDGFYDKARALLTKVHRLFPGEIDVDQKMDALQRAKRLEHTRDRAKAGLLSSRSPDSPMSGKMAVEFEAIWNELSKTSLVDRISSEDFSRVFSAVEIVDFTPGRVLMASGSRDEVLFVIAKGTVEARARDGHGHTVTLRSFGRGEIIGERALFHHAGWCADYCCTEKAKVLRLERKGLETLIAGHPDPRGLLDTLREQRNDEKVAKAVRHLTE